MGRLIASHLGYFLLNFATPVAFFCTFHLLGAKPAIGLAIAAALLQAVTHLVLRIRFSPFFIVATGFTVAFGMIDLFLVTPRFFRLEPFAQNALIGTVLLVTVFTGWPLMAWFASGLPTRFRPDLGAGTESYLRKVTLAWAIYLWLKALLFLYLAFRVNLANLIVLRSLIGGISIAVMVLGEIAIRRWLVRVPKLSAGERPGRSTRNGSSPPASASP